MTAEYIKTLDLYVAEHEGGKYATAICMLLAENEHLTRRNNELEQVLDELTRKRAAAEDILLACVKKFEIQGKYNTADKLRAMIERWVKPHEQLEQKIGESSDEQ